MTVEGLGLKVEGVGVCLASCLEHVRNGLFPFAHQRQRLGPLLFEL